MAPEIDGLFKFQIGQECRMKAARRDGSRLVILERLLQNCDGGIQISYLTRGLSLESGVFGRMRGQEEKWKYTLNEFRCREMELEEIPTDDPPRKEAP